MNKQQIELKIVVQNGDQLEDLAKSALEVVSVKSVATVFFSFNECKLFINKQSTLESVKADYESKMRLQNA